MNHFQYKGDELHCEDVPLATIAGDVGTPVYIYSHATLTRHFQVFKQALSGIDHLICFAVKSNSNIAVLNLLFRLGAGADIVSGGELYRVLRAGGSARKVVFSGVGKTPAEMRKALEARILMFNVESREELDMLDRVAGEMGVRAPISLRVNPDVDAETHPYISTGLKKNKFGIPMAEAIEQYAYARSLSHVEIVGVDCHIGSQLTKLSPFVDAIGRVTQLVKELGEHGIPIRYFDIGGGLGISYGQDDEPAPPSPDEYGQVVRDALAPLASMGVTLVCEPGRVIVGNAGVLLTQVIYRKSSEVKHFTVVDAAMNDLMRPALYGSFHPLWPVHRDASRPLRVTDVVGPICETGDFVARDRNLPGMDVGDLLAVGAAGAYGFSMASNYNTRPRAAEVLVKGDRYAVIRERETLEQLVAGESIPDL